MRVVSTFFAPSSVLHSVKCRLDTSEYDYLVVTRSGRLEVFVLRTEGAKLQCSLQIWGAISSLTVAHHKDAPDTLLVTTETPDPLAILLEYVPEVEGSEPFLRGYNTLSLRSSYSRSVEFFEGALVHPSGDVAVVATYIGKLKALVLKGTLRKKIKADFDCILTELNVLSMCFVPVPVVSQTYVLAILHRDYTGTLRLLARDLSIQGQELSIEPSNAFPQITITEDDSNTLVPIPPSGEGPSGVLVLGGQSILFFELGTWESSDKGKAAEKQPKLKGRRRKTSSVQGGLDMATEPRAQVDWPLCDIISYALIDSDGSRILLGDAFGKLCLLSLTRSSSEASLTLVRLGETSPATTMAYLNSGVIFVGSHHGDSQIVRITPSADPLIGIQLDVLDTFKNIAPIMDAIFVDAENSGQAQIVTCSGAFNTGSLRIIRNGADLEELAVVDDMTPVKLMWPLKFNYEAQMDNMLVISTLQSTRFYSLAHFEQGIVDELDEDACPGFSVEPTFAISNMSSIVLPTDGNTRQTRYDDSQFVVQVTSTGVLLVNLSTGMRESTWQGETDIVAACANGSQVAVALKGSQLVILSVRDSQLVELRSRFFQDGEISTVTIHPYDTSLPFSNYVAVGFYESNTVSIVHAAELMRPFLPSLSLPHLPVSLLLCQFGLGGASRRRPIGHSKNHPTHLLAGLGDGNLHVYGLDVVDNLANVCEQRLIPLGSTKPVFMTSFRPLQMDSGVSEHSVLASGSRPVVLYWDNGRLKHSALVRKGISAACPLNSKDFPSSIIFALNKEHNGRVDATSLLIGRVRELQKLHIRTIPFGLDNPVRIAHHLHLKVLGVGCERTQPHRVGEFALQSCSFKIIDDTTFEQLHHFPCDPDEEITVVQTLSLSLDDSHANERKTYFVVGSQYHQPEETEAHEGRIMLFEARDPWLPEPQADRQDTKGRGKVGLATSFKVKGCVFAVAEIDGQIAAGINESVYIFRLKTIQESRTMPSTNPSSIELEVAARWTHNYIVSNIVSRGDRIYISDAISSLSVIQWDPSSQTLQNVARDYTPLWPVAIQTFDKDNIVGCNNDCNLFVYTTNATENRLEQVGNYYLGDCVNKFLPGSLTSQPESNEAVRPEQMFMTSNGRIGVISGLSDQVSLHMTALQRNLGYAISGPGDMKHAKWRAPKNSRGVSDSIGEATGFLDGDFLERLLDFNNGSPEVQKAMEGNTDAEKLPIPFSEVVNVLEQLQAVH
ncbi:CPSF A subunit region-domain-containing protein [Gautieria morchelliformis]|nr:CPSF A subunit region-domain-containing protein [Gautieria morchelliformis]